MKLKVLGSSSLGNGYILETADEALIIEVGLRLSEYKKALGWSISKAVGAIVTHEHNDHAGSVREVAAAGIRVYALPEVFSSHGMESAPFTETITPMQTFKVGGFRVMPIPVEHDVPCVAYLIHHSEMGKLLFVTDTVAFNYSIPKLSHIMMEANYADDILDRRIAAGTVSPSMRNRLLVSHMEISNSKAAILRQDLTDVNEIILVHLSGGNSNQEQFETIIHSATGKSTMAAEAGMETELNINPY